MTGRVPKNKNPRYLALKILTRVEAGDAYADILLGRELSALKDPDRALAMELVYGVLRWQIKIDWIIDSFSRIKTKKLEHRVLNFFNQDTPACGNQ
jgi:16S rRNA (cytosine967-C5)-methyltransferase